MISGSNGELLERSIENAIIGIHRLTYSPELVNTSMFYFKD